MLIHGSYYSVRHNYGVISAYTDLRHMSVIRVHAYKTTQQYHIAPASAYHLCYSPVLSPFWGLVWGVIHRLTPSFLFLLFYFQRRKPLSYKDNLTQKEGIAGLEEGIAGLEEGIAGLEEGIAGRGVDMGSTFL